MKKQTKTSVATHEDVAKLDFTLSDATALAEAAMAQAAEFCVAKLSLKTPQAALALLQHGDRSALGYFYYSLAKQAAEWLGTWDEDILAVYLYDLDAAEEGLFTHATQPPLINLIIRAKRKTGALHSMAEALNRALAHSYGKLIGSPHIEHLLDAQIVEDDQVKNRIGYGALLSSTHYKPIQIWER